MDTTALPLELHAIERLRQEELEEARAIQSMMMPAEALRAGAVTVSHEFQPVTAVGGDFLDYFELTDKTIGLYLGDVSGKGLPAALYAALAVDSRHAAAACGHPICRLRSPHQRPANRQCRHTRPASSGCGRLPHAGASRHARRPISGDQLRYADSASAARRLRLVLHGRTDGRVRLRWNAVRNGTTEGILRRAT